MLVPVSQGWSSTAAAVARCRLRPPSAATYRPVETRSRNAQSQTDRGSPPSRRQYDSSSRRGSRARGQLLAPVPGGDATVVVGIAAEPLRVDEHPALAGAAQHVGRGRVTSGVVRVVENPESRICPPGWVGIVRLAGAVLVTAPTAAQAELLRRTTDPDAPPVLDQLGPAQLAYAADQPRGTDPAEWAGQTELLELVGAVTPEEADESGVAGLHRAAVVREKRADRRRCGLDTLAVRTAHLCVLAAADARGRGLATRVAAAATADARAVGMLPQWRARVGASQRVAAKLGYRVLGEQLSLRLQA